MVKKYISKKMDNINLVIKCLYTIRRKKKKSIRGKAELSSAMTQVPLDDVVTTKTAETMRVKPNAQGLA